MLLGYTTQIRQKSISGFFFKKKRIDRHPDRNQTDIGNPAESSFYGSAKKMGGIRLTFPYIGMKVDNVFEPNIARRLSSFCRKNLSLKFRIASKTQYPKDWCVTYDKADWVSFRLNFQEKGQKLYNNQNRQK